MLLVSINDVRASYEMQAAMSVQTHRHTLAQPLSKGPDGCVCVREKEIDSEWMNEKKWERISSKNVDNNDVQNYVWNRVCWWQNWERINLTSRVFEFRNKISQHTHFRICFWSSSHQVSLSRSLAVSGLVHTLQWMLNKKKIGQTSHKYFRLHRKTASLSICHVRFYVYMRCCVQVWCVWFCCFESKERLIWCIIDCTPYVSHNLCTMNLWFGIFA